MISVFLLDDHETTRRVVAGMVDAEQDMRVTGTSATQIEAIGQVHALDPDVAVLDVCLKEGNGIEACREIRSVNPRTACLFLTALTDDEAMFHAIIAGASGYVLKQHRSSHLVDAVHRVALGESLLDPALATSGLERIRDGSGQDERVATLTAEQRQILDLMAEGLTNRAIADRLFVGEKSVKAHVTTIISTLGMNRPGGPVTSGVPDV